jgi:hypothetical protein
VVVEAPCQVAAAACLRAQHRIARTVPGDQGGGLRDAAVLGYVTARGGSRRQAPACLPPRLSARKAGQWPVR